MMRHRFALKSVAAALCSTALLAGAHFANAQPVASVQAIQIAPRIQLSPTQFQRLQAVANEGPDALRRYLWRTRMIYNWTYTDLVEMVY
jgi:hypothetical protein